MFKDDQDVIEEYEQALNNSSELESPVTFRYDYSPELYEIGRHPVSHILIGFNNEIRIGCYMILDPLSFTAFVIHQNYPEIWKNTILESQVDIDIFKSSIREALQRIDNSYLFEHDKLEMYLD